MSSDEQKRLDRIEETLQSTRDWVDSVSSRSYKNEDNIAILYAVLGVVAALVLVIFGMVLNILLTR